MSSHVGTGLRGRSAHLPVSPPTANAGLRSLAARALAPHSVWSAVTVWVVWTTALLTTAMISVWFGPHTPSPNVVRSGLIGDGLLWPLRLWDYSHYLTISEQWYAEGEVTLHYAFFPLFPAILAVGSATVGAAVLGTVVAIGASAAAFVGVAISNPLASVRRTAIALACLPTSYVLLLAYPDGLALAAAVWAWVLASRDRWASAAVLGIVAATARPNGFLIAIPLLFLARRATAKGRWVAVSAPPLAFLGVLAYFWFRSGDPFAYVTAQDMWLVVGHTDLLLAPFATPGMAWEAALALLAVALCAVVWRSRLHRSWAGFATAVIAMSFASGTVTGTGRRILFAFPLAWAAANARWFGRAWAFALLGACLSILHMLTVVSHVP